MQDKQRRTVFITSVLIAFLSISLLSSTFFFCAQIFDASQKELWGDETHGLKNARNNSYLRLLIKGAPGQGSPSPLDYIAIKFLDNIKQRVNYFSLPPRSYFRLFSNLNTLLCLWIVFIFSVQSIISSYSNKYLTLAQFFLLTCVTFTLLFKNDIYYYATEMRPYALWTSLWFLCCAILLKDKNKKILFFILMLLAFSATAFIFQLISLIIVYVVILLLQKSTLRDIAKTSLQLFTLPLLVTLFYCFKSDTWGYTGITAGTWEAFWKFWTGEFKEFHIIIVALIFCLLKKENRKYSVLPLTMLAVFSLGPLIYWVTRARGFFFTARQYLYYNLATPLALLTVIKCLPAYMGRIQKKPVLIAVVLLCFFAGSAITFRKKIIKEFSLSINKTLSILNNGLAAPEAKELL